MGEYKQDTKDGKGMQTWASGRCHRLWLKTGGCHYLGIQALALQAALQETGMRAIGKGASKTAEVFTPGPVVSVMCFLWEQGLASDLVYPCTLPHRKQVRWGVEG